MSDFIVIGVSGSEHGHPALEWGVAHAIDHRLSIQLVHVVDTSWGAATPEYVADAVTSAERLIREEADRVSSNHPDVAVHGVALVGAPDRALIRFAEKARMLVVGSHGTERFGDVVFSRLASRIAERADCTVAVIPSTGADGTGVVVGVDGSDLSMKALRFGAAEADRLGEPLTAVHAWTPPWPWDADHAFIWPDAPAPEDELVLSESLAGIAEDFPDLTVIRSLPSARPADALYAAANGARLLAVGSHGRGALERAWFGSVSADLLLAMPCPVVVVR